MKGRVPQPLGTPTREWLHNAIAAFEVNGGRGAWGIRVPLTLLLFDLYEQRMSATRAGIEAATRFKEGKL